VHHIQERQGAQNGILEDGTHMNDKRNLVVICEGCHDKTHARELAIGSLQMTSDGPQREIKEEPASPKSVIAAKKKGKWSDEERETIVNTLKKYSTLSLKSVQANLSSKWGIEISVSLLGKIRNEL
jgi:hypothetical protein